MLDIDRNLRCFWETEEIGPETCSDIENTKELIKYEDGRYKVPVSVPWKEKKKSLTLNSDGYALCDGSQSAQ